MFEDSFKIISQPGPSPRTASRQVGELLLTRVFHAPRGRVFRAWTDPGRLAQWWGPKGFSSPECELDPRPGGAIRILMRGPDGTEVPVAGVFREVMEPEDLVFVSTAYEDARGYPRLEVLYTVTFAERNGDTTLTLDARILQAAPELAAAVAGMEQGWRESLGRLQHQLYS
jgi:uncharacterized protein YndB with AHSA1/START domain